MRYTPNRWFPEDVARVTKNDPCHTFVPIEEVADPSALLSFEDIEIIKKINEQDIVPEERSEVYFFATELNGCTHISTVEATIDLIRLDENGDLDFFEVTAEDVHSDEEEEPVVITDGIDHQKSNREKLIDRVYKDVESCYRRQKEDRSDIKNRSKKSLQKKQRSRRVVISNMKINGFPIEQPEAVNILDTISE